MSKVPKFYFEDCPPAKPTKVANLHHVEAPQAGFQEHVLTCFECPRHEHDTVNPSQGWGRCTLKKQGCYGLRPACSEIPRGTGDGLR